MTYPQTAPDIVLAELEGKTAKMYKGGKICQTVHFHPLWSKNAPHFGIAHALALGLGPWLAAEIPVMVDKGLITHEQFGSTAKKDENNTTTAASNWTQYNANLSRLQPRQQEKAEEKKRKIKQQHKTLSLLKQHTLE